MAPKADAKEKAVKGEEAEELVLKYMKQVNRPYSATDVSANLKNQVTKVNAQKILQALSDKGELTIKLYGKQSVFVYNQDNAPTLPSEQLAELDTDFKAARDDLDAKKKTLKGLTTQLAQHQAAPKTSDLPAEIGKLEEQIKVSTAFLEPLRAASGGGASAGATKDDVELVEKDWIRWRKEWVSRKKVYYELFDMVMPDGGPAERAGLEEQVGVEQDTDEVKELEQSELCKPASKPLVRPSIKPKVASEAAPPPSSSHAATPKVASSRQQSESTASSPTVVSERSTKSSGVKRKRS